MGSQPVTVGAKAFWGVQRNVEGRAAAFRASRPRACMHAHTCERCVITVTWTICQLAMCSLPVGDHSDGTQGGVEISPRMLVVCILEVGWGGPVWGEGIFKLSRWLPVGYVKVQHS